MNAWPADKVERRSVESLIPSARNARTHSDAQIDQLVASIREWGWTIPVLVDEAGRLIAGHGRVMAAKKLGLTDVPAMTAAGWTEEQKRAYALADNQLALNSGWDPKRLGLELSDLQELGVDLAKIGFAPQEMRALLGLNKGLTDPDEAPAVEAEAVSRLGDVWLCGAHRVACGDSTDAETVTRALGALAPHLMVTDPPYGVNYDANWRNEAYRANGKPYGARAVGKVKNDDRSDWSDAYKLFPGDVIYVWHPPGAKQVEFYRSIVDSAFEIRMQIIWAKQKFPIGRGHYHVQHEPCWYAVRKGATAHWQGDRTQSTLWQIDKPVKSETGHSTQKPIECMRRPIVNNSAVSDAVYDPFLGSGTTLIAAQMEGRACIGIELHPQYADVAVRRWQAFTGDKATLEGDARSFDEIAEDRAFAAAV